MARGLTGRLYIFLQVKAPCEAGNFEFNQLQSMINPDFVCSSYMYSAVGRHCVLVLEGGLRSDFIR